LLSAATRRGTNCDAGRSAALVALCCDDHVVVATQIQSHTSPRVEVGAGGDGSTDALRRTDTPILLEGSCALNGGLVGAGRNEDFVCATVAVHGTFSRCAAARVVSAIAFDNVVLDERVGCPSVDGEVSVTIRAEGAGVGNGPWTTGVPALSSNEITYI